MDTVDQRIEVVFRGRSDNTLRFQPLNEKRTIVADTGNVIGASLLNDTSVFRLRALPGQRYLVEGIV